MDKNVVELLTKEMPVLERLINAYLASHPELTGVVVNGVRFGELEPIEVRFGLDKLTEFFDGDVDKATNFAVKDHENFGFKPAFDGLPGGYKPCKDGKGNVFYKPINHPC